VAPDAAGGVAALVAVFCGTPAPFTAISAWPLPPLPLFSFLAFALSLALSFALLNALPSWAEAGKLKERIIPAASNVLNVFVIIEFIDTNIY